MQTAFNKSLIVIITYLLLFMAHPECVWGSPGRPTVNPTVAAPATLTPTPTATAELVILRGGERHIISQFNRARRVVGARPLVADRCVMGVAKIRAQDMATNQYLAHVSPTTGQSAASLVEETCSRLRGALGEVVARTNSSEEESYELIADGFLDHLEHRVLIEWPVYDRVGIASVDSSDGFRYFAVVMLHWQD